jgi:hypothetical protein
MLLAVAIKVKGVVITSSPDPMPKAFKHKKRADVQLEVVTKSAHPKKEASLDSSSRIFGPEVKKIPSKTL